MIHKIHSHTPCCDQLLQLEGLPLIPCGAGDKGKAPLNPDTGGPLSGWQNASYTPDEIAHMGDQVLCVGTRCGPAADGLVGFDLDGSSAIERAKSYGCKVFDSGSWTVGRNNSEDRLAVFFLVTKDRWSELPGKSVLSTGKGEQLEVFWSTGQKIVYGHHKETGGQYIWLSGSPQSVLKIPPEWLDLWQAVISKGSRQSVATSARQEKAGDIWRDAIPCEICGRREPDCRISNDAQAILCHHGKRWHAPQGLNPGETLKRNGQTWAFCGERKTAVGTASLFRIDRPRLNEQSEFKTNALSQQGTKKRTISADEALKLLPERLGGIPRLNIRTRHIELLNELITPDQANRLYVSLSNGQEKWVKQITVDALDELAGQNQFDPVDEYLHSLNEKPISDRQWRRLDQLLFNIDDPVASIFMSRYLVAAVARVLKPGCLVRQLPVLVGPQGIGKTELGRALFGSGFYTDGLSPKLDIDDVTRLTRVWCLELGELDGITRKTQLEHLKAFLSRRVDISRRKYGRGDEEFLRRSVFWGTSNSAPLRDPTGSNRFVCIRLPEKKLPSAHIEVLRDAIWTKALQCFHAGEQWYSTDEEMLEINQRNSDYVQIDPWADIIIPMLGYKKEQNLLPVRLEAIYERLEIAPERQNTANAQRIRQICEANDWVNEQRRPDRARGWWPTR